MYHKLMLLLPPQGAESSVTSSSDAAGTTNGEKQTGNLFSDAASEIARVGYPPPHKVTALHSPCLRPRVYLRWVRVSKICFAIQCMKPLVIILQQGN